MVFVFVATSTVAAHGPLDARSKMSITSPAFKTGEDIPVEYTCDGANRSPALRFANVPPKAVELVLVVDDPDAPGGTFTHWLLYGIPAGTATIAKDAVPKGAREGTNDAGSTGWTGPCPPPGQAHRYFFELHALSARSGLAPGASADAVEHAIRGKHVTGAQTMGQYCRRLAGDVSSCLIGTWPP